MVADILFRSNTERSAWNVVLPKYNGDDEYEMGYLTAAKLVGRIAIYSPSHTDTLVYPIVFLYRHHIEIKIKALVEEGWYLRPDGEQFPLDRLTRSHNLEELGGYLNDTLVEIGLFSKGDQLLDAIGSYVTQIQKIDPKADAFRYSYTRTSAHRNRFAKSFQGMETINIIDFCASVEKLTTCLEAIGCEIKLKMNEYRDWLAILTN